MESYIIGDLCIIFAILCKFIIIFKQKVKKMNGCVTMERHCVNETMITARRSQEFSRKSREVNGQRGYSVIRTLMEEK